MKPRWGLLGGDLSTQGALRDPGLGSATASRSSFDSVWAPNGCSTGGPLECGGSTPLSCSSQRSQLARFTFVRQHEPARTVLPKRQLRRKEKRCRATALQSNRLRFAADDTVPSKTTPPTVKPAPIQDLTAKEKRSLQRRWSALEPLTLLGRAPQEIDYTNRVAELQDESKDFSARTLRRTP